MAACRVVQLVDERLVVINPAAGVSLDQAYQRSNENAPEQVGRPFIDTDTTNLPSQDSREAWRLVNGQVVIDAAALADIEAQLAVPDYGSDIPDRSALLNGVAQLRAYLQVASPTGAQTVGAVKLLIRVTLFTLRRLL